MLVYATGGLAYGHVEVGTTATSGAVPGFTTSGSDDAMMVGYTFGGGAEMGIGNSGWSVKAEYLYVDLGEEDFAFDFDDGATSAASTGRHVQSAPDLRGKR